MSSLFSLNLVFCRKGEGAEDDKTDAIGLIFFTYMDRQRGIDLQSRHHVSYVENRTYSSYTSTYHHNPVCRMEMDSCSSCTCMICNPLPVSARALSAKQYAHIMSRPSNMIFFCVCKEKIKLTTLVGAQF